MDIYGSSIIGNLDVTGSTTVSGGAFVPPVVNSTTGQTAYTGAILYNTAAKTLATYDGSRWNNAITNYSASVTSSILVGATETTLFLISASGGTGSFLLEGSIDLSPMTGTDQFTFRLYSCVTYPTYSLVDTLGFTGSQATPILKISRTLALGDKVTAQKTAGTDRTFTFAYGSIYW